MLGRVDRGLNEDRMQVERGEGGRVGVGAELVQRLRSAEQSLAARCACSCQLDLPQHMTHIRPGPAYKPGRSTE